MDVINDILISDTWLYKFTDSGAGVDKKETLPNAILPQGIIIFINQLIPFDHRQRTKGIVVIGRPKTNHNY